MNIYKSISGIQNFSKLATNSSKTIGFVPTMGALHQGHISLLKSALQHTDIVVASIFVNPTQFNNPEDLAKYPKTLEEDLAMLSAAGCHAVFVPEVEEVYPSTPKLTFHFGVLETLLEGKFRPGHFSGVAQVVSKLFHYVQPDFAFFGQKDLQQVAVVKQLVNELSFPLQIVVCPTVREKDGLAMSSRNRRLDEDQRASALKLFEALQMAKSMKESLSPSQVKATIWEWLCKQPDLTPEYFEVVHPDTFELHDTFSPHQATAFVLAVHVGQVRLIDNLVIRP